MGYCIDHLFDSPVFYKQLEIETPLERLKRERSKNRLTFKRGGEIMTLTLDARNARKSKEAAMGFGAPNVVLDESSLIDDELYATVKRMLGGHKDNFLFEIGNPFYRNHFHRTWHSPLYEKIFADWRVAVDEGRFSNSFIDEMRDEALFDVFYDCTFPDATAVDDKGYRQLIIEESINIGTQEIVGRPRLGADIGGGGDLSMFTIRYDNHAFVESTLQTKDTMQNVVEVERILDTYGIKDTDANIDDIGIGRGVSDRLKERGRRVNGVSVGAQSKDRRFTNRKAQYAWRMKKWVEDKTHTVAPNPYMPQLAWYKYKVDSDKKIRLEPKPSLIKRTGKSPDFADSLMLTFHERPRVGIIA